MPLMFAIALAGQITPMQPMPKGTGLPPGTEEAAVMAPIDRMLRALETNDGAAILAATRPEGGATVAYEAVSGKRGVKRLSWAEFVAWLKTEDTDRYREEIRDPAIEVDGDVAMVWAPYTVFRNGAPDHWGYDHFDMVREGGSWKVLNVTWSQRTTGCAG